jgi:hypothetical protein
MSVDATVVQVNDSRGAWHVRFMRRIACCAGKYTTIRNRGCHVSQDHTRVVHIRAAGKQGGACARLIWAFGFAILANGSQFRSRMTDNTTSSPADTLSTEADLRDVDAQPAKPVLEKGFSTPGRAQPAHPVITGLVPAMTN